MRVRATRAHKPTPCVFLSQKYISLTVYCISLHHPAGFAIKPLQEETNERINEERIELVPENTNQEITISARSFLCAVIFCGISIANQGNLERLANVLITKNILVTVAPVERKLEDLLIVNVSCDHD